MTKQEQAALKRVAKKLSAMRATLNKSERNWLDRLILGESEVAAHRAHGAQKTQRAGKVQAAEVAAHAATAPQRVARVARTQAAEVAAHAATAPQRVARVARTQAAEVAAHAATIPQRVARVNRTTATQAAANQALLEFDATTGGYRINDNRVI